MVDLSVRINDILFPNPVLSAAGPNVRTGRLMRLAAEGGAGGIVAKTVSRTAAADARPTIRGVALRGLVNSETWSEIPVESFLAELVEAKSAGVPLIASVGYSPEDVADLGRLIEREVGPAAIEFSTHYSGNDIEPLLDVARSLRKAVSLPIWMKVSPATPRIDQLARKASEVVDAFVAINSFGPVLDFDPAHPTGRLGTADGSGWLSGPPIRTMALQIVHTISSVQAKPVIGVGGVEAGEDGVKLMMAGASAVQVCTAAIRKGHAVYGRIAAEMARWMERYGYNAARTLRGVYKPSATDPATPYIMTVDTRACTGCRACISHCVQGALEMREEKASVIPDRCIACGYCQDWCPTEALSLKEQKQ